MNKRAAMNNKITCLLKIKGRSRGHWLWRRAAIGRQFNLRASGPSSESFVINQSPPHLPTLPSPSSPTLNSTISRSILSARLPRAKPLRDVSPYLNYSKITDTPPPQHTHTHSLVSLEETENHFTAEQISPRAPFNGPPSQSTSDSVVMTDRQRTALFR